jgi:hypothetical protein
MKQKTKGIFVTMHISMRADLMKWNIPNRFPNQHPALSEGEVQLLAIQAKWERNQCIPLSKLINQHS